MGLNADDFTAEGKIIQLGVPPNRIDILTSLTGCDFEEVWSHRVAAQIAGIALSIIGREQYIRNKRAVGRPQALADLDALS